MSIKDKHGTATRRPMAKVAMQQAPNAPTDEDVAPSNIAAVNPLLAGACDDDNELTEARKATIEEKQRALQARFKAFEEKRLTQQIDELVMANDGLTNAEAEMTGGNEFEASDPLSYEDEDHEQFRKSIKRHKKNHKVGGRLKLDDALVNLAAAQNKAEEDAANGGVAEGGCGSEEAGAAHLMDGWSDARKAAWSNRLKNENQYYYRFNEPGESQAKGKWTSAQHTLFMETLESVRSGAAGYPMYKWGLFSKNIPGKVGYTCGNYYRSLIQSGDVVDGNYMVDASGQMRFEQVNTETGDTEVLAATPNKVYVPNPNKIKAPKPPPKPKKAKDDDRAFRCRDEGSTKKYADGDGDGDGELGDDEDDTPVLPDFVDPLTPGQIQEPAISPYGHVAGYKTRCIEMADLKTREYADVCEHLEKAQVRLSSKQTEIEELLVEYNDIHEFADKADAMVAMLRTENDYLKAKLSAYTGDCA